MKTNKKAFSITPNQGFQMSLTFAHTISQAKAAVSFLKNRPHLNLIDCAEELLADLYWFEDEAIRFHRLAINNEDASLCYKHIVSVMVDIHGYDETEILDWIEEIVTATAFH